MLGLGCLSPTGKGVQGRRAGSQEGNDPATTMQHHGRCPSALPTVAECSRLDTGKDETPTLPNCTKGRLIEQETKPNVGKEIHEEQSAAKKTEEERSRIHK